jgi:hypothetical protein
MFRNLLAAIDQCVVGKNLIFRAPRHELGSPD